MGCTTIQNLPQDSSFLPKQDSPFLNITENFIEKIKKTNGKTIHRLRSKQIKVPILRIVQESSIWKRRMKNPEKIGIKERPITKEGKELKIEKKDEGHLLLMKRLVMEDNFRTI